MKFGIQKKLANKKNVKTIGQAEDEITYNNLLPDLAIFVLGVIGGFMTLLTIFS